MFSLSRCKLALLLHPKIFWRQFTEAALSVMVSQAHTAGFALLFSWRKLIWSFQEIYLPAQKLVSAQMLGITYSSHQLKHFPVILFPNYYRGLKFEARPAASVYSHSLCSQFHLFPSPPLWNSLHVSLPSPLAACLSPATVLPPTSSPLPLPLWASVAEHERASAKMKESFMSEIEKVWADHKKELEESLKVSCCSCTAALVRNFQLWLQVTRAEDLKAEFAMNWVTQVSNSISWFFVRAFFCLTQFASIKRADFSFTSEFINFNSKGTYLLPIRSFCNSTKISFASHFVCVCVLLCLKAYCQYCCSESCFPIFLWAVFVLFSTRKTLVAKH